MPKDKGKGKATRTTDAKRDQKVAVKKAEKTQQAKLPWSSRHDVHRLHVDECGNYGHTVDIIIADLLARDRTEGDYLNLILTCDGGDDREVKLYIDRHTLYLVRFEIDNTKFEFGKFGAKRKLGEKSKLLGYEERYSELIGCDLSKIKVGKYPLVNAVKILKGFERNMDKKNEKFIKWKNSLRGGLATLIVMFPEASRFTWIYKTFKTLISKEDSIGDILDTKDLEIPSDIDGDNVTYRDIVKYIEDWMINLVHAWKKISEVAKKGGKGDNVNTKPAPALPGDSHVYTTELVELAKKYKALANHVLSVPKIISDDTDDSDDD